MNKTIMDKINEGRQYRAMTMRAADDTEGAKVVRGYATTFNQPYLLFEYDGDKYYEQVSPDAFKDCDMSDVIMQYDHEGRVFARLSNNTLKLTVDPKGLLVEADLGGTDLGRGLYEEIKGGYTNKMSFGFIVAESKWENTKDEVHGTYTSLRTITKIKKLFDVSAVSLPANDFTEISARSAFDGEIERIAAERRAAEAEAERLKKVEELRNLIKGVNNNGN